MVFDPQPELVGQLVFLRPLRPDDYDALYAVAADPLIWAQHPVPDRHEPARFRAFFDERLASGGALLATDRADGRVIGSTSFAGYDPARREVEVGWTFLARSHWGGRYNGEMKRLMLGHAFGSGGIARVLLIVGAENVRSQRAVERVGGRRVGAVAREATGPHLVYAITAEAFAGVAHAAGGAPAEGVSAEDVSAEGAPRTRRVSRATAEHYAWGAAPAPGGPCDGWHLVRAPGLSVIEERVPPGAGEVRHRHARARQFFYVLAGMLHVEVEGVVVTLGAGEGVEVPPGAAHEVRNRGAEPAEFLVVSQPPSHGDREPAGARGGRARLPNAW